jgi:hypothetical protein
MKIHIEIYKVMTGGSDAIENTDVLRCEWIYGEFAVF